MRRLLFGIAVAACTVALFAPEAVAQGRGQTQTCQNVPVKFSLDATRPDPNSTAGDMLTNAIFGDNGGPYINGVGGVSAVINMCPPATVPNDLTLDTGNKRTFVYVFPNLAPGSSTGQTGTLGGMSKAFTTNVFFRNLLYGRPPCDAANRADSSYSFTTDAFFAFPSGSGGYRLRFVGPNDADTKWPANQFGDDNSPFMTSNVMVTFHPGDCSTTPDSWTVSGYEPSDPANPAANYLQLGTIHQLVKGNWIHIGQYEMPFQLQVTALVNRF